jgi:hypothetical protein
MKTYIIFFAFTVFISCKQEKVPNNGFDQPVGLDQTIIVPVDSINSTKIKVTKPLEYINASDLIDEVRYIPLETTSESLIGYYVNIQFCRDKIFILDDISGIGLFIFDMHGKFIKKIGKTGAGPLEFGKPSAFCISRDEKQIVMYDNWKRRNMYYDGDGIFLKRVPASHWYFDEISLLNSNTLVTVTGKMFNNSHLGDLDRYRLIFTDTAGIIKKAGFEFDDNRYINWGWSKLIRYNEELLFYQQYGNSIYTVTDTLIREKYRIDCSEFATFDLNRLKEFTNPDVFKDYWNSKANLNPYIAETNDFLYFVINNKIETYMYFYHKKSEKLIGFKRFSYDNDFVALVLYTRKLFTWGDYFIATVSVSDLTGWMKNRQELGLPISDNVAQMINSLKEDDNDLLVLFKLKEP